LSRTEAAGLISGRRLFRLFADRFDKASCTMTRNRAAFSLLELMIVVMLVGVMAAIAVPRFSFALITKHKSGIAARKIATDLRRTRRLAISDAANNAKGFQMKMLGGGPFTSYEIENLDTHVTVDTRTIDSEVTCNGDSSFDFEPLGNLNNGASTEITVEGGGRSYLITVTVATGAVKCVEN